MVVFLAVTIDINGFSMIFESLDQWFQWFQWSGTIGETMELFQWIVQAYLLIFQWNRVTTMIVKEWVDDNGRGGL